MSPKEFAIPRASMSDIIEETKSKNSSREIYLAAHMVLYTRSFSVCEPLAPSKFIWKFAKFVLYQRSLSPQSLRTLSLPIHIDRNDRNNAASLHACHGIKLSIPKNSLLLH